MSEKPFDKPISCGAEKHIGHDDSIRTRIQPTPYIHGINDWGMYYWFRRSPGGWMHDPGTPGNSHFPEIFNPNSLSLNYDKDDPR